MSIYDETTAAELVVKPQTFDRSPDDLDLDQHLDKLTILGDAIVTGVAFNGEPALVLDGIGGVEFAVTGYAAQDEVTVFLQRLNYQFGGTIFVEILDLDTGELLKSEGVSGSSASITLIATAIGFGVIVRLTATTDNPGAEGGAAWSWRQIRVS